LKFLVNDIDVPYLKVSSADISNLPFLYEIACSKKHVMLSTGTASLGDIEQALSVFALLSIRERMFDRLSSYLEKLILKFQYVNS
jgi:sialic acid synthase SpsE